MGHKVKQSLMSSRIDFFYYTFRNVLLVSIPLLVVSVLILGFSTPHSSAESNNKSTVSSSSSDNISFTLSTSCTISGEVISAHTASLNGGQLVEDVGHTKMNAYCNDNNGYSIYVIGSSGDIDGNTDLISSISDSYNVKTGVYDSSTASSLTPSSWAMKLTAGIGTGSNPTVPTIENGYDSYKEVPDIYTLVAKRTSKTDMSLDTTLSGSYINTTYQIYASSIQPAGTYSGKVKYVMMHPNSNNNHLGFNEVYALHNKTPITTENGTYYTMQDMDTTICNQVGVYDEVSQTQLLDTRDNKLYWIAKLKDGHCWMTQNLDLDIGSTDAATLNSENTDISADGTISGVGIYADGYSVNNGIYTWIPENSTTNSSWTNSVTKEYSYDPGNIYPDDLASQQIAGNHGLSGNFYNWTAAVASNNSVNISSNGAANSVCPKNWRLPNYDDKELDNLFAIYGVITAIGSNTYSSNGLEKLVGAPLYFIRAGGIGSGGNPAFNVGAVGYSWYNDSDHTISYTLRFTNNEIKTNHPNTKADGLTIRCVARSAGE